ncbi:PEP-CTERM sorting domain-containing protein [Radiobacillus deserti]|uniref:PEP-CTERM sorting domain-containing protein n=1 Tax=Radiobacillus deserti TaxID=2594883 RepID=A0A516KLC7_9BACI|nr:PEP-CTERM sorting domain-containing protein [Radiobacillus deserti]
MSPSRLIGLGGGIFLVLSNKRRFYV